MEKYKLSKESRRILLLMAKNSYPNVVPEKDLLEVKLLRQTGFVHGTDVNSGVIIAPQLTEKGQTYIHQNPKLKNPTIFDDSKYIITTTISIIALIVATIALFR